MATLGLAGEERDEAVRLRRGRRGRGRQARHWRRAPWSRARGVRASGGVGVRPDPDLDRGRDEGSWEGGERSGGVRI